MTLWVTASNLPDDDVTNLYDRKRAITKTCHDDRSCPRLKPVDDERIEPISEAKAEQRDLELCDFCSGEMTYTTGKGFEECPFCETQISNNLPDHLPECSQA